MHSPLTPQLRPPILATSIATFATSLIASPPAPLSQEQLTELDQLAKPTAEQTLAQQNETKQTIESEKKLHTQSRASMKPFLEKIGQGALLAQAPAPQAEPENPQPKDPQTPPEKPGHTSLLVECDGGLYFDNDTGILAYLKNIRLTETRFKLTCSDELKVFLAKKEPAAEEPDKDTDTPEEKQPGDEAEEKEDNLSSFGEVSKIIATGNVKITRKDDKGRPFIATGETASYDATTGEIILRGGRPRLQQSKNQYLQAQEPGAWIRIFKNGKLVTSNNKWQMFIVRDNPAPQP